MNPIIVDPHEYDQNVAVEQAEALVLALCEENRLELPLVQRRDCRGYRGYYRAHRHHLDSVAGRRIPASMFWLGYVYWDPHGCKRPVKTPGYAWSFTGYKADNTAPGVIAHEVGHHVWECRCRMEDGRRHDWTDRDLQKYWAQYRGDEPSVTSYGDTSVLEDFAETMKIFALNPDLLRCGRPMRWSMLVDGFGLRPVVTAKWDEILQHAHVKLLEAAANWIKRGSGPAGTGESSVD